MQETRLNKFPKKETRSFIHGYSLEFTLLEKVDISVGILQFCIKGVDRLGKIFEQRVQ